MNVIIYLAKETTLRCAKTWLAVAHALKNSLVGWVVVALFLAGLLRPAAAVEMSDEFKDWNMTCLATMPCVASTTTFAEDRTWLATLRLQPDDLGNARVQVLVPSSVHLASGVFLATPGVKRRMAVLQRCTNKACDARMELDRKSLTRWKRARNLEVFYRPHPQSAPIRFSISLMGLTAALASIETQANLE